MRRAIDKIWSKLNSMGSMAEGAEYALSRSPTPLPLTPKKLIQPSVDLSNRDDISLASLKSCDEVSINETEIKTVETPVSKNYNEQKSHFEFLKDCFRRDIQLPLDKPQRRRICSFNKILIATAYE